MARQQTDKKIICLVKSALINGIISDRSEIKNISESAVIEQILIDHILPQNKIARDIVEEYLYGNERNIGKTLSALFSYNSIGGELQWSSRYHNFIKLVQYAKYQECLCNTALTGKEELLPHCILQIESVIKKLETLANTDKNDEHKLIYKNEATWGKELLLELKNQPQYSHLFNFYTLILNNWNDLKGWNITYRLLNDLVLLEPNWRNNYETRTELLEIIIEISNEWSY